MSTTTTWKDKHPNTIFRAPDGTGVVIEVDKTAEWMSQGGLPVQGIGNDMNVMLGALDTGVRLICEAMGKVFMFGHIDATSMLSPLLTVNGDSSAGVFQATNYFTPTERHNVLLKPEEEEVLPGGPYKFIIHRLGAYVEGPVVSQRPGTLVLKYLVVIKDGFLEKGTGRPVGKKFSSFNPALFKKYDADKDTYMKIMKTTEHNSEAQQNLLGTYLKEILDVKNQYWKKWYPDRTYYDELDALMSTVFPSDQGNFIKYEELEYKSYKDFANDIELYAQNIELYGTDYKDSKMIQLGPLGRGELNFQLLADGLRQFSENLRTLLSANHVTVTPSLAAEPVIIGIIPRKTLASNPLSPFLGVINELFSTSKLAYIKTKRNKNSPLFKSKKIEEEGGGYAFKKVNDDPVFSSLGNQEQNKSAYKKYSAPYQFLFRGFSGFAQNTEASYDDRIIELLREMKTFLSLSGAREVQKVCGIDIPTRAPGKKPPMKLLKFVETFIKPSPDQLVPRRPPETPREIVEQRERVGKKPAKPKSFSESWLENNYIGDIHPKALVQNRNVKVSDQVGDKVFRHLGHLYTNKIRWETNDADLIIKDLFGHILGQLDLSLLARKLMECLGANFSLMELYDRLCNEFIRRVDESGSETIYEYLDMLGSYSYVTPSGGIFKGAELAFAIREAMDDAITAGIEDPFYHAVVRQQIGGREGKKMICEFIIGVIFALDDLLKWMKTLQAKKDFDKPEEIPSVKKCWSPNIGPRSIPMLDKLLAFLIKEAQDYFMKWLIQFLIMPIKGMLWSILEECQEEELDFGGLPFDRLTPDEPYAGPYLRFKEGAPIPIEEWLRDLFATLNQREICQLLNGEATPLLMIHILRFTDQFYPSVIDYFSPAPFTDKMTNFFVSLGKVLNTDPCYEEIPKDKGLATLCKEGETLRQTALRQSLKNKGLTDEQIEEQIAIDKELALAQIEDVVNVLTSNQVSVNEMTNVNSIIANAGPMIDAGATAINQSFKSIENAFDLDITTFMPLVYREIKKFRRDYNLNVKTLPLQRFLKDSGRKFTTAGINSYALELPAITVSPGIKDPIFGIWITQGSVAFENFIQIHKTLKPTEDPDEFKDVWQFVLKEYVKTENVNSVGEPIKEWQDTIDIQKEFDFEGFKDSWDTYINSPVAYDQDTGISLQSHVFNNFLVRKLEDILQNGPPHYLEYIDSTPGYFSKFYDQVNLNITRTIATIISRSELFKVKNLLKLRLQYADLLDLSQIKQDANSKYQEDLSEVDYEGGEKVRALSDALFQASMNTAIKLYVIDSVLRCLFVFSKFKVEDAFKDSLMSYFLFEKIKQERYGAISLYDLYVDLLLVEQRKLSQKISDEYRLGLDNPTKQELITGLENFGATPETIEGLTNDIPEMPDPESHFISLLSPTVEGTAASVESALGLIPPVEVECEDQDYGADGPLAKPVVDEIFKPEEELVWDSQQDKWTNCFHYHLPLYGADMGASLGHGASNRYFESSTLRGQEEKEASAKPEMFESPSYYKEPVKTSKYVVSVSPDVVELNDVAEINKLEGGIMRFNIKARNVSPGCKVMFVPQKVHDYDADPWYLGHAAKDADDGRQEPWGKQGTAPNTESFLSQQGWYNTGFAMDEHFCLGLIEGDFELRITHEPFEVVEVSTPDDPETEDIDESEGGTATHFIEDRAVEDLLENLKGTDASNAPDHGIFPPKFSDHPEPGEMWFKQVSKIFGHPDREVEKVDVYWPPSVNGGEKIPENQEEAQAEFGAGSQAHLAHPKNVWAVTPDTETEFIGEANNYFYWGFSRYNDVRIELAYVRPHINEDGTIINGENNSPYGRGGTYHKMSHHLAVTLEWNYDLGATAKMVKLRPDNYTLNPYGLRGANWEENEENGKWTVTAVYDPKPLRFSDYPYGSEFMFDLEPRIMKYYKKVEFDKVSDADDGTYLTMSTLGQETPRKQWIRKIRKWKRNDKAFAAGEVKELIVEDFKDLGPGDQAKDEDGNPVTKLVPQEQPGGEIVNVEEPVLDNQVELTVRTSFKPASVDDPQVSQMGWLPPGLYCLMILSLIHI